MSLRSYISDILEQVYILPANAWVYGSGVVLLLFLGWHLIHPISRRRRRPEDQNITIDRVMVHPIKSCMACDVQEAKYDRGGFDLDRKWMVYDVEKKKQVSARDNRGIKLVQVKTTIVRDSNSPSGGVLRISFPADPSCEDFDIHLYPTLPQKESFEVIKDISLFNWSLSGWVVPSATPTKSGRTPSEIFTAYLGREVRLVLRSQHSEKSIAFFKDVPKESALVNSFADVSQGMLISNTSLNECSRIAGGPPLAIERYRPNLFVRGVDTAFGEDDWLEIEIGPARFPFHVPNRTPRCMFPSVDPETGKRDGIFPHRSLLKTRRVDKMNPNRYCLGVYLVPRGEGIVRVGDKIRVIKSWNNPILTHDLKSHGEAEKNLVALADA
ncbi:hypothetical protein DL96DRAFT_1705054 [Flagelloscypha sp. PMI_526]|nr:hypothetical protein DL96DRAFT_1705054 [Flagelloscypha sp. PMI_526]